jgi:transposase InsO family protein
LAWATKSHASKAAEEFFELCLKAFPYSFNFLWVLTDNGSEFKKHFAERLRELHLIHYHTYPKCPQMNTHIERFNRTIQEEFIDYFSYLLVNPDEFNRRLVDYLIFYNTERVHCAFKNKLSPAQFMVQWQKQKLLQNQQNNLLFKMPVESKIGWHYT